MAFHVVTDCQACTNPGSLYPGQRVFISRDDYLIRFVEASIPEKKEKFNRLLPYSPLQRGENFVSAINCKNSIRLF